MSRGHGAMERHVLAVLSEHRECGVARMLALHPDAGSAPWRSLQSSLGRALRRLEAEELVFRVRYSPGEAGWRDYGGHGFMMLGDRKGTAYHEAGHAVVARVLGIGVKSATIKPDKETAGLVRLRLPAKPPMDLDTRSAQVDLAGALAELQLYADKTQRPGGFVPRRDIAFGAGSDRKNLRHRVRNAVSFYDDEGRHVYIRATAAEVTADLKRDTRALVRKHWPQIERVATALIERETLTGAQIDRLMEQRKETAPPRPARRGPRARAAGAR